MNEIILEKIKCPFESDIHRMHSMRHRNSWLDIYGITYILNDNTLIIINSSNEQLIPSTIVSHINALPEGVRVIIELNQDNSQNLNLLLDAFTKEKSNKDVIIDIKNTNFKTKEAIPLLDLPTNVKISNTSPRNNSHYFGNNDFDYWLLNTEETDFFRIIEKLDPASKRRALELQEVAYSFYSKYADTLERLSNKEKCNFTYRWLRKNTSFASDNVQTLQDGSQVPQTSKVSDPIETYRTKKGVCSGRSSLFKALLNNRYLNINCFLVKGSMGITQHVWCEVYFDNNDRIYYDANFILNNPTVLPASYKIENDSDAKRNGFSKSENSERSFVPLPPRNNHGNNRPPALPPRNNHETNRPPALPPRNNHETNRPPALPPRNNTNTNTPPPLPPRKTR